VEIRRSSTRRAERKIDITRGRAPADGVLDGREGRPEVRVEHLPRVLARHLLRRARPRRRRRGLLLHDGSVGLGYVAADIAAAVVGPPLGKGRDAVQWGQQSIWSLYSCFLVPGVLKYEVYSLCHRNRVIHTLPKNLKSKTLI
jgi:hypothetical protein